MLLAGQRNRAEDGNENQNRGDLEGKQQIAEKHLAEVAGGYDVIPEPGLVQVTARGKEDERQQADQDGDPGDPDDVGRTAAVGDVLIDTSGGAAALIVASLFVLLGKVREKRQQDEGNAARTIPTNTA